MTLTFSKTTLNFAYRNMSHWNLISWEIFVKSLLYNNLNCTVTGILKILGTGILKILISPLLLLNFSPNKSSSDEIKIKIKLNHIKNIVLGFSQATICLVREF